MLFWIRMFSHVWCLQVHHSKSSWFRCLKCRMNNEWIAPQFLIDMRYPVLPQITPFIPHMSFATGALHIHHGKFAGLSTSEKLSVHNWNRTLWCHRIFILDTLMCRFFVPIRLDPGEIKGAWGPMPVPNDSSTTLHNENRTGYHQIVKIISDSWEISAPIRLLSSCDFPFLCSKSRNHNFREHFAWKLRRPGECTALLPLFVRSGFWVW